MKTNYLPWKFYLPVFLFLFSMIAGSCNRDRNHPGWDYFNDMAYTAAYKTFSKNPNFKDGMTMRIPPPGTVPRDFMPFEYTLDPESRIKAGKELINPVFKGDEALSRGKMVFSTFCIGCHGRAGTGDGQLFASGLYPLKPRDLSGATASKLKDGEIYHSITLGFGSMGAHGSQILPEDRWKLVLYIRTLQEDARGISVKPK
jgi:mono/diheme cytochrome c family protein